MPDKMIENEMVTPYADDDPIDEPQEQDGDEAYDLQRADNDYADLNATLKNIGRLHSVTSEIEELTQGLRNSLIEKPQA